MLLLLLIAGFLLCGASTSSPSGAAAAAATATNNARSMDTTGLCDLQLPSAGSRHTSMVYQYEFHEGGSAARSSGTAGAASDRKAGLRVHVELTPIAPLEAPHAESQEDSHTTTATAHSHPAAGCLVRLRMLAGTGEAIQSRFMLDTAATHRHTQFQEFQSVGGPSDSLDKLFLPHHDMYVICPFAVVVVAVTMLNTQRNT